MEEEERYLKGSFSPRKLFLYYGFKTTPVFQGGRMYVISNYWSIFLNFLYWFLLSLFSKYSCPKWFTLNPLYFCLMTFLPLSNLCLLCGSNFHWYGETTFLVPMSSTSKFQLPTEPYFDVIVIEPKHKVICFLKEAECNTSRGANIKNTKFIFFTKYIIEIKKQGSIEKLLTWRCLGWKCF